MFNLIRDHHHAPFGFAVESHTLTQKEFDKVYSFISNNYCDSPAYQAKDGASPFLQGQDSGKKGRNNWVLIEFWSQNEARIQNWINLCNEYVWGKK